MENTEPTNPLALLAISVIATLIIAVVVTSEIGLCDLIAWC